MKGIADVKGFLCGTGKGNIKETLKLSNKKDILVIVSEKPATAAAIFTTNDVKAAPVKLSQKIVKTYEKICGIVANSGNANACTGERGMKDAKTMAKICQKLTGKAPFLVASTGVIGEFLPMDRMKTGIEKAVGNLGKATSKEAAEAIMTTDTFPKTAYFEGKGFTIGGIAKGAGMIDPAMATMLSFITTDVEIEKKLLEKALKEANEVSFNAITVDGDMSTNDTVIVLANGASEKRITEENYKEFLDGLTNIMKSLAYQIVKDGEGATKVARIKVIGARTKKEARKVARKIALSPLVKTAIFGCDPNWGRIIAAAGSAGVKLVEERIELKIGDYLLFKGTKADYDESKVHKYMKENEEIVIEVDLNLGSASFEYLTCDFTYEYVKINAEYRT
ncbi:bifunctional glutamate N-acetyltransferase/amino-acid acetyltransferase ArgJ [Desulfurobacterium indicum]|uniref:Arginine biosynthesis bifunctional protein ArgJ n=1 Tax=Desulfurobacterium indicum TaxID=1914305 RepID=A0A1R1MMQ6_9BACT|nr:bifunctional glutamate N-acetyltransferase/amino-acid acetyltransferase ArgJ [Desulfurobacterium indicum]OMH41043.1 bifunctional ornithine acetyltransferase/N-acetylglutamate synthase [Desulfurobacterium indicum]